MTRQLGLVANCRNAWPDRAEMLELRPAWVRTIVYALDELDLMLEHLPPGVRSIVLLNGELDLVGHDWHRWPDAVVAFAERFGNRVDALECLNEWDLLGIPADVAVRCAQDAAAALRGTGCTVLLGSVAGPDWTGALRDACALLGPAGLAELGGVCLHPYGQRPGGWPAPEWGFGELEDAIMLAAAIGDRPVWLTELGVKLGDVGGEAQQAEFVGRAAAVLRSIGTAIVPSACWFAWSDTCGAPHERGDQAFGLIDESGRRRPAWSAFRDAAAIERFQLVADFGVTDRPIEQPVDEQQPVEQAQEEQIPMAHTHSVGPGASYAMAEDGTKPASCELYYPLGRGPNDPAEFSETMGRNGTLYRYVFDTNTTHRFPPDPATAA